MPQNISLNTIYNSTNDKEDTLTFSGSVTRTNNNINGIDTNTDTNTTYTAGTGLSLSGTSFKASGYNSTGKTFSATNIVGSTEVWAGNNCRLNSHTLNFNASSGRINNDRNPVGILFGALDHHHSVSYAHIYYRQGAQGHSLSDNVMTFTSDGFEFKNRNGTNHALWYFTGIHRCITLNKNVFIKDYIGLIMIATGDYISPLNNVDINRITITDAEPVVDICNKKHDKRVLGILSKIEDIDLKTRNVEEIYFNKKRGDRRLEINSLGEGGIWVCNQNGSFENGDFIVSSDIPGYGIKQDDDFIRNYTVAKITTDCSFNEDINIKKKILTDTYVDISTDTFNVTEWTGNYIEEIIFDIELNKNILKYIKEYSNVQITEYIYDENLNLIIDLNTNTPKIITKDKKEFYSNIEIDYKTDENGVYIVKNMLDDTSNVIYEPKFKTRYLDMYGNILTKDDYFIKYNDEKDVYIACFVGCTYHCG